jgi:predicted AAA+ superfamily ATPase
MNRLEYRRPVYTDRVMPFIGKPVIKIITGMRRVGKSCILRQLVKRLHATGVRAANILFIDKESLEWEAVATCRDLNNAVRKTFRGISGRKFLFVDEVQEIEGWEKAVTSIARKDDVDIIITGSNAHMLSGELSTLLSGRYIEFPVNSLSFSEFLTFRQKKTDDTGDEFRKYLRYGGMPGIHHFELTDTLVYQYLSGIYSTLLLKDVVKRYSIRNVPLMENVIRFIFDNLGNLITAKRISDYLKSQKLSITVDTVQSYIGHLQGALMMHKISRYDIRGRRHMELCEKYYLNDIGLRHAQLGYREGDPSGILENLVFLELKARGYTVSIGRWDDLEVDFIASRENEKIYVQVAYLLSDRKTIDREVRPLKLIQDNYPKYVLSMDTDFGADLDGIHRINLVDFLLSKS